MTRDQDKAGAARALAHIRAARDERPACYGKFPKVRIEVYEMLAKYDRECERAGCSWSVLMPEALLAVYGCLRDCECREQCRVQRDGGVQDEIPF